ncbi:MAG: hypothetical protein R3F43_05535 [bacterium]
MRADTTRCGSARPAPCSAPCTPSSSSACSPRPGSWPSCPPPGRRRGGSPRRPGPDLLHLRGLDRDGKPRWRKRFQAEARGIQALFVHDGRVLLYAGEQARWVDAATGERGPAIPVPYLSSPGHPGCWLNPRRRRLRLLLPCEFRFAQADGAPLGGPYRFHQPLRARLRRQWLILRLLGIQR